MIVDSVRREEAATIADIVSRLIGHYPVWDKDQQSFRPVRAGEIALLAPTGTSLWIYERALEEREIPIATQAGKGFFRRQEVQDLIAIARTIADLSELRGLRAAGDHVLMLLDACRSDGFGVWSPKPSSSNKEIHHG